MSLNLKRERVILIYAASQNEVYALKARGCFIFPSKRFINGFFFLIKRLISEEKRDILSKTFG